MRPAGFDPQDRLARCEQRPWAGIVWRFHARRYPAIDPGGSRRLSGRYHRAVDAYRPDQSFPALYTATTEAGAYAELIRHVDEQTLPFLAQARRTRLRIMLHRVLDISDPASLGLDITLLTGDEYAYTQVVGAAAIDLNAEALLVPSAAGEGPNLVIFVDNLRADSSIHEVDWIEPRLRRS